MRKMKTFIGVLMLVFVLGLAAPQALAGDQHTPGVLQGPPAETAPGEVHTPGLAGEINAPPTLADWTKMLIQILGNSWKL